MISAIIHTALAPVFGGRVYPNTFRQPDGGLPRWPACRYQIIDSIAAPDLCGTVGVNLDDTDVQIDIVALTYGAAAVLRDQSIAALLTTDPPCTRTGLNETFDAETKTHRVIMQYRFQPSSALTGSPS